MLNDVYRDGKIVLYGTVGGGFFFDESFFTAADVVRALAIHGDGDVEVFLNSGGGGSDEGTAIYNSFKQHKGKVTIRVMGIAASAASTIACAGNPTIMAKGSLMMIHDTSIYTEGDVEEHKKSLNYLEAGSSAMAAIYAAKSGKTPAEMRKLMKAETWFLAQDAVDEGLADQMDDTSKAGEVTAFDYRLYAKAPERMRALAAAKDWKLRAKTEVTKEKIMTNLTPAPVVTDPVVTPPVVITDPVEDIDTVREEAAQITSACVAAGVPAMATALIREKVKPAAVAARLEGAKQIKAAVALANKTYPNLVPITLADTYIGLGTSIEAARADLFGKITSSGADQHHITSQHGNAQQNAGDKKAEEEAETMRKRVVEKTNARFSPVKNNNLPTARH